MSEAHEKLKREIVEIIEIRHKDDRGDDEIAANILSHILAALETVTPEMADSAFGAVMLGGRHGPNTADFFRHESQIHTYKKMLAASALTPTKRG